MGRSADNASIFQHAETGTSVMRRLTNHKNDDEHEVMGILELIFASLFLILGIVSALLGLL
jgi:hypothetical protein